MKAFFKRLTFKQFNNNWFDRKNAQNCLSIDENTGFLFFFFREENVTEKDVCVTVSALIVVRKQMKDLERQCRKLSKPVKNYPHILSLIELV